MEATFVNETAKNIFSILRGSGSIAMCWGISSPKAIVFNEMASLKFHVNGFLYKGIVTVSYNGGADLFEVFIFEGNEVKEHISHVYFDTLVDVIDSLVETTNSNSKEYKENVNKFFNETLFN